MNIENLLVNLKLSIKAQERMARRCAKQGRAYQTRMRDAIRGGDEKIILMYGQQTIRQDNMRVVFARMAVQTQIIYDNMQMARQQHKMTESMVRVARIMASMSRQQTPEQMVHACESLRESSDTIQVCQAVFDNALGDVTSTTTPHEEVASLIARVSEEHKIDLFQQFADAPAGSIMAEARNRVRIPEIVTAAAAAPAPTVAVATCSTPNTTVTTLPLTSSVPDDFDQEIQRRLANLKS